MLQTNTAISVNGLEKSYKNLKVLNNVRFSVQKGHIFALLGSNGAGKTTTIKILTTLLKPDSGNVHCKIVHALGSCTDIGSILRYLNGCCPIDCPVNGIPGVCGDFRMAACNRASVAVHSCNNLDGGYIRPIGQKRRGSWCFRLSAPIPAVCEFSLCPH